jgi:hypothetical protein
MNWAEFALIAIIVVAVIVLAYLNFQNFNHFMENYFIFIIIIIFVVLIITLNFNNSTAITTYMKVTKPFEKPLIYEVPTQAGSDVTSIMTINFSGLYNGIQVPLADNTSGVYYFDYDSMVIGTSIDVDNYLTAATGGSKIFKITKTGENRLQVELNNVLDNKTLDGYLTIALLATGNQDVNGGFERIQ